MDAQTTHKRVDLSQGGKASGKTNGRSNAETQTQTHTQEGGFITEREGHTEGHTDANTPPPHHITTYWPNCSFLNKVSHLEKIIGEVQE
jgi:hypothetical protein